VSHREWPWRLRGRRRAGSVDREFQQTLTEQSEIQGFAGLPAVDIEATVRTLKALHQKLSEPVSNHEGPG
jgi:hypothetical protein